ncbi:Hypothetical protein AA314_01824 [Archangium gephyra]|uniref:Uncharacterized protein n=1 Tax=Archangium gephyra TaxID=48 RepID=A0AAC8Q351_9BACT|nr:Hypothetical protein AA314_01824 [Archangium gephyra]
MSVFIERIHAVKVGRRPGPAHAAPTSRRVDRREGTPAPQLALSWRAGRRSLSIQE